MNPYNILVKLLDFDYCPRFVPFERVITCLVLDPYKVTHNQWREGFCVQLEPFVTFDVSVS